MRPTTRSCILDYLRKHQTASAGELCLALRTSSANIRHHLSLLVADGLIEFLSPRREGRGRPVKVYGLSARVLGDGLCELAGALFDAWLGAAEAEEREAGLRSVARHMAGLASSTRRDVPLTQRLTEAVRRLNELPYQARWEAGAAGARIVLGRCPYAVVVPERPELCRLDTLLLEEQLGLDVTQTAKLERSARGETFCIFEIRSA